MSMAGTWEDSIILAGTKTEFELLEPVQSYVSQTYPIETDLSVIGSQQDIDTYVARDTYPLPVTEDREGYHGERHYDFWLSGLADFKKIAAAAKTNGITLGADTRVLDFGCASGRNLRHFAVQSKVQPWGCDISENHVLWCNRYLPSNVKVFQNT